MNHLRIAFFVLCLFWCSKELQAQEAVLSSGGDATGSGGSVSYSAGQVACSTNTGTNGSVAQGVQQPFEISVVTELPEAKAIILQCSVFPNPASDYLVLKVENYNPKNLSYRLSDVNGKLLESKKLEGDETTIGMSHLAPAAYFLKVTDNQKEIKTFQIIKN